MGICFVICVGANPPVELQEMRMRMEPLPHIKWKKNAWNVYLGDKLVLRSNNIRWLKTMWHYVRYQTKG